MSLKLNINPIEIPELLHLIGSQLSIIELKTCMLVSRTWHAIFQAYLWHHLNYNSQGIPHLGQYGHLVRRLDTYNLGTKDLYIVAGSCHFVQELKLDVGAFFTKLSQGLETIVANMPHICDLTLLLPHAMHQKYFCALSRLKNLRHLSLSTFSRTLYSTCDLMLLLNVVQECPRITSLSLENTIAVDRSLQEQPASDPGENDIFVASRPRPGYKQWWWNNALSLVLINKSQPKEEPWRKFDKITPVENEARLSDQALFCMPDASKVYPLLTRLEFKNVVLRTPTRQSIPFGLLFKKAPYLKELYMDFTRFKPSMVSECLDAITANCMELTNLTFERLHNSTLSGQISIHTFFRTSRPGLRRLTLKGGVNLESALDLIPDGTANGLQHLRLEEMVSSHVVLHRLLQRCSSLQSLAWTMAVTESITDLSMRLSVYPEPWACYETLRHAEFGVDAMDKDSFDAYFRRLAQADRLASMLVPLCDLRRSIIKRGDDMKGWYFPSVQELTLRVGFNRPLCSLEELHYTLQAFPKLRKIRYEGKQYPLDDEARHYLASQVDRSIMVIHTTQSPTFVK